MPYNSRTGSGDQAPAYSYQHSRALAFTVLAALVFLIVIRFFYGSIRIEGGVK